MACGLIWNVNSLADVLVCDEWLTKFAISVFVGLSVQKLYLCFCIIKTEFNGGVLLLRFSMNDSSSSSVPFKMKINNLYIASTLFLCH